MSTTFQIKAGRPGHFVCFVTECGQRAVWKGEVAGHFNAGRSCGDHKTDLAEVTKNVAREWQPCPCPSACGR